MSKFKTIFGKLFLKLLELIIKLFILIFFKIRNLFVKKTNPIVSMKKRIFRFSLIVLSIFILLITKFSHLKINLINIVFEITIFFILYLITLPKKEERIIIYAIKNYIFNILFYLSFLAFILNSIYIMDTMSMKFTIFNFNPSVIPFVFQNMIKVSYIFYFIISVLLLNLFSIYIAKKLDNKIVYFNFKDIFIFTILLIMISSMTYVINPNNVTNIYVNTIEETYDIMTKNKIQINDVDEMVELNNSLKLQNLTKDKKILVFVMEQTSLEDFNRELINPTFFELVKDNTHFYSNYYTQNQDSRTSLWAMMYSVFQPFESYIDRWNEYYGYIMDEINFVDILNYNNYKTLGVSSAAQIGLIMGAMNWSHYINLKDYENKSNNYICFNEFEYQKACEDLAILDELKEFVKINKNESYFVFEEMIFGHGENYMLSSKKSRTQYYNDYFYDLYKYMIENNLIDDNTYFIIVSDHGPKGGFNERNISDFNIPFFVINENYNYIENDSLVTHVDFIDILNNEIFNKNININRNETFFIGQTSRNVIGYKSYQSEFVGTLLNDIFVINNYKNTNLNEIENKIIELKILQNSFENKSKKKYFYCEQCLVNIERFE